MDDDLLELNRLAGLRRHADLNGSPAPGSFYCHEALHMASFLASSVDAELCDHPAILSNPDWYRLATEAQDRLAELYAAIGKDHVPADDPNAR